MNKSIYEYKSNDYLIILKKEYNSQKIWNYWIESIFGAKTVG